MVWLIRASEIQFDDFDRGGRERDGVEEPRDVGVLVDDVHAEVRQLRTFGVEVASLEGAAALTDRLEICLLYTSPSPRDA